MSSEEVASSEATNELVHEFWTRLIRRTISSAEGTSDDGGVFDANDAQLLLDNITTLIFPNGQRRFALRAQLRDTFRAMELSAQRAADDESRIAQESAQALLDDEYAEARRVEKQKNKHAKRRARAKRAADAYRPTEPADPLGARAGSSGDAPFTAEKTTAPPQPPADDGAELEIVTLTEALQLAAHKLEDREQDSISRKLTASTIDTESGATEQYWEELRMSWEELRLRDPLEWVRQRGISRSIRGVVSRLSLSPRDPHTRELTNHNPLRPPYELWYTQELTRPDYKLS